jgi:hypothetical protein
MNAGTPSDPEALEIIRRQPELDPRKNPQLVTGPASSRHSVLKRGWSERTQLCAIGERVFVKEISLNRYFLWKLIELKRGQGRNLTMILFPDKDYQISIRFGR